MRILFVCLLAVLAGCQTGRDNPDNQYMGQYAPARIVSNSDGAIGIYGKAWGDDGKAVSKKVAYRRLYQFAKKNGFSLYYLASEKHERIEKGTKALFVSTAEEADKHIYRVTARVFSGTLAAPRRARTIDRLREMYDPTFVRSLVPESDLDDTDLLADLNPADKPISLVPGSNSKTDATPVSTKSAPKTRKKKADKTEEPLVILAPES